MPNRDLPAVIITVIIAGIILFIGISAVSTVVETGSDDAESVQTAAELNGTQWVALDDSAGTDETVFDSRGYAVALTGADDSYTQTESDISLNTSQNWTVSAWASRADSTAETQTVLSLDGEIIIAYNGTTGNWVGWFYDAGDRASYNVTVNATTPPGDLASVVLVRDGDRLTIYENTTGGSSVMLTGTNTAADPNGTNWHGRLEEIRVHNSSWDATTRNNHYSNPIDPVPAGAQGRIMFDEPYRDTQRLFYESGDVATSNATFGGGIPGSEMQADSLLGGDYEWQSDGPRIRPLSGGELDGAPVAYVDYQRRTLEADLLDGFTNAVGLAGILLILVPLSAILSYLLAFNRGR